MCKNIKTLQLGGRGGGVRSQNIKYIVLLQARREGLGG